MKKIHSIEIKNYRSIKKQIISDFRDLNIFSGGNDVGKSNVLRALDIFFNDKVIDFYEEFNIHRKAEIRRQREKQIISVKIVFTNSEYKNLPPKFYVKKTWDKTGKIITTQDDIATWRKKQSIAIFEKQSSTALSMYLNRFKFRYIPAIKDDSCFNSLLIELYNTIIENTTGSLSEFESTLSSFNNKLAELSQSLSEIFLSIAGIRTTIAIPTNVNDLARRLSVSTYANNGSADEVIPLFNRGDGIRMQYIPSILNYISSIEKNKWYIWAIDEPETSCEYSKSAKLAEEFRLTYCKSNQIFISSHSFHFISLQGENISRYRVINNGIASDIVNINDRLFEDSELKSELGIFDLLNGLQSVYENYMSERLLIQDNIKTLNSLTKPILLFEGESDRILFRKALLSLYPSEFDTMCFADDADRSQKSVVGEGVNSLYGFLAHHIPKIGQIDKRIIAIFDNDEEGRKQFDKIKKDCKSYYDSIIVQNTQVLKHKRYNVYILCLIPPSNRLSFVNSKAKYCYLSSELLLQDSLIPAANRDVVPNTSPQIFSFNSNNKVNFASNIQESSDFSGFRPTIDLILTIKDS